jgi:hypothetical protein
MSNRSQVFDPARFGHTLWRDVRGRYDSALISVGAGMGALLVFSLLSMLDAGSGSAFHTEMFSFVLIVGGVFLTSGIFKDLHRKETIGAYLLLPASALEKVVTRILIAGIGWALFTLLWYTLFSFLSEGVNSLIFGRSHALFDPFRGEVWLTVANYLVVHSIFLVGAVYFRKLHLLKTLLALFLAGLALGLLATLTVRFAFWDYFQEAFRFANEEHIGPALEQLFSGSSRVVAIMEWVGRIVYWALLPVLCWVVTYLRFREVEVHHGI